MAGVGLLGACGGGSAKRTQAAPETLVLSRVFPGEQPAGVPVRLPLAVSTTSGVPPDDLPDHVTVRVNGGAAMRVDRHGEGIPKAYFPLVTTFPTPGTYRVAMDVAGATVATTVSARPRQETAAVPGPGEPLPPLSVPTNEDHKGVDPICTADPPCPLHEAPAKGLPLALLVATPKFCQTAICGPVLDLLVARRRPDVAMVHAEVYRDATARVPSPTHQALGLTWEPSLFLCAPDGSVRERLDYTFDGVELDAALARLAP